MSPHDGRQIWCGLRPEPARAASHRKARLAETLGYDIFFLTDSHLAGREAMAMLGALALGIVAYQHPGGLSEASTRTG